MASVWNVVVECKTRCWNMQKQHTKISS